jgi:Rrf2 family protein
MSFSRAVGKAQLHGPSRQSCFASPYRICVRHGGSYGSWSVQTSTRFAVATHLLCALAVHRGRIVPSERVALSANTTSVFVRRLVSSLTRAGIVASQAGKSGGTYLVVRPERISLLDVFRAVEEPEIFTMHHSAPDQSCFVGRNIQSVLRGATDRAQHALELELARTTIADLALRLEASATEQELREILARPFGETARIGLTMDAAASAAE